MTIVITLIVLVTIVGLVYIIMSKSKNIDYSSDPDTVVVQEGTQASHEGLKIGVGNIQGNSGDVFLLSKNDNKMTKRITTGDKFEFENYNIQILNIKGNTRLMPASGGSNGFIVLKITQNKL